VAVTTRRVEGVQVAPGVSTLAANAVALERETAWLVDLLEARIHHYFEGEDAPADLPESPPPEVAEDPSEFARLVREHEMSPDERAVLALALLPHLRPQALDLLFIRNRNLERGFAEFGGRTGTAHGGFLPTLETAAFLVAGTDLSRRFEVVSLFDRDHFFVREGVLDVEPPPPGEPFLSAALSASAATLDRVTTGVRHRPDYSLRFPARRITTELSWDDLVVDGEVMSEVVRLKAWLEHADTIMEEWGLRRSLKPGYRSLFHGPPGTGKTLTATLIGASVGADVYRIDLSMLVSKYVGETEKNLAVVFDQAEKRDWILFFDEADAIFGKRTQTTSAHDRYANQEVSYLLQRVEDFPGLVILATNLKANMDEAFARRFQSVVYFPMPDAELRLRLWKSVLGPHARVADDVDLARLARDHELSGGAITNVVRYAAINALHEGRDAIRMSDLVEGVRKELRKEGRTP
jgi:AAA+ superfamily predicted ATPase